MFKVWKYIWALPIEPCKTQLGTQFSNFESKKVAGTDRKLLHVLCNLFFGSLPISIRGHHKTFTGKDLLITVKGHCKATKRYCFYCFLLLLMMILTEYDTAAILQIQLLTPFPLRGVK